MNHLKIIGLSIETTNQEGKAAEDLRTLWERFYSENIPEKIPNKLGSAIYSIYTDYENTYTGKYTAILGLSVSSLDEIPKGLTEENLALKIFKNSPPGEKCRMLWPKYGKKSGHRTTY